MNVVHYSYRKDMCSIPRECLFWVSLGTSKIFYGQKSLWSVHMEEGCQFGDLDKLKLLSFDDNPMLISRDKIIFT